MSLITSCPACATRFKIVPDQLKISDGWVRCGTCSEVFDASKRLEDPQPDLPAGMTHVPVLVETIEPAPAKKEHPPAAAPAYPFAPATPPKPEPAQTQYNAGPPPASPAEQQAEQVHHELAVYPGETPVRMEPIADLQSSLEPGPLESEISPGFASGAASVTASVIHSEPNSDEDINPSPDELQFVKQARRAAMWKKPWVRIVLALLVLLLGATLALQYAVHERDKLAARNPQTRELLTGLCQWLQCEIRPLRDPEAIVIESSRFQKGIGADNGTEVYQLAVQLRNRADHAVAWPALELSLTGTSEQAMIRVVLDANKYAPADSPDIAAGREYSANIFIKLDTASAGGRVSGYRLLAFYP